MLYPKGPPVGSSVRPVPTETRCPQGGPHEPAMTSTSAGQVLMKTAHVFLKDQMNHEFGAI